jgi:hypothetical protein
VRGQIQATKLCLGLFNLAELRGSGHGTEVSLGYLKIDLDGNAKSPLAVLKSNPTGQRKSRWLMKKTSAQFAEATPRSPAGDGWHQPIT